MNFMEFIAHPVTQALWDGVRYTAPKVMYAIQHQMAAKPVTQADINQAAAGIAQPDFSDDTPYTPFTETQAEAGKQTETEKESGNEGQT